MYVTTSPCYPLSLLAVLVMQTVSLKHQWSDQNRREVDKYDIIDHAGASSVTPDSDSTRSWPASELSTALQADSLLEFVGKSALIRSVELKVKVLRLLFRLNGNKH